MDFLNDVVFDEKAKDTTKRAANEYSRKEESSWYRCSIGDYGENEPNKEEKKQSLIAEYCLLAEEVLDHGALWVEQKCGHRIVHAVRAEVLDVFGIDAALILAHARL